MKELVYVDCDRTLVNTDVYPVLCKQLFFDRRKIKFFFQWRHIITEARPSAREFLSELRKNYRVEILSLGHSVFQTRVLTELGLIDLVDKIWGPDNCQQIPRPERFVLIDDMEAESIGIAYKMNWLGRKRSLVTIEDWTPTMVQHFIQCHPFNGGLEDQRPLTDFLPVIQDLLNQQISQKATEMAVD